MSASLQASIAEVLVLFHNAVGLTIERAITARQFLRHNDWTTRSLVDEQRDKNQGWQGKNEKHASH